MATEPVEILKGENVSVSTTHVTTKEYTIPLSEIGDLEVRKTIKETKAGDGLLILSLFVMFAGYFVVGITSFLIGGVIALLSIGFKKKFFVTSLLSKGPPELELYTNIDPKQVEKMKKAIELAKTWPKTQIDT